MLIACFHVDNLLPHPTSMAVNGAGTDENAALNDFEMTSNSYNERRNGSVKSIRTSPRIIQEIDFSNSNADDIANEGDTQPAGMISKSIEIEKTASHLINRNNSGIMDISKRCYSDVTSFGNSLEKAVKNNKEASQRSQSARDLPEFASHQGRLPYVNAAVRLPEYATGKAVNKLFAGQIDSSGFEGSAQAYRGE